MAAQDCKMINIQSSDFNLTSLDAPYSDIVMIAHSFSGLLDPGRDLRLDSENSSHGYQYYSRVLLIYGCIY